MSLSKRRRVSIQLNNTLDLLPAEIWEMILDQCDLLTLLTMRQVSRLLYDLIIDPTGRPAARIRYHVQQISIDFRYKYRDRDDDKAMDELGQLFGLTLFQLPQSDGCELTMSYSYHIYFRDFIERPGRVQKFRQICRSLGRYAAMVGPVIADFKKYRPDLDITKFDPKSRLNQLNPTAISHLEDYFKMNWEEEMKCRFYENGQSVENRPRQARWWLHLYITKMLNQSIGTIAGGKYYFSDDHDREFIIENGIRRCRFYQVYRLMNRNGWMYSGFENMTTADLTEIANYLVEVGRRIDQDLSQ